MVLIVPIIPIGSAAVVEHRMAVSMGASLGDQQLRHLRPEESRDQDGPYGKQTKNGSWIEEAHYGIDAQSMVPGARNFRTTSPMARQGKPHSWNADRVQG